VLLVEADRQAGRAIAQELIADGFSVELAHTAEHARILAARRDPEIALIGALDHECAAGPLLGEIRATVRAAAPWRAELPAIVLGERGRELDAVRAFEAGADDFMSRRASYLELRARVRAVLRRSADANGQPRELSVATLCIDMAARRVSVDTHAVAMRKLEYELLLHLARDPERVFSRSELLRVVWGHGAGASSRTVDSHASRVRRKLSTYDERAWVVNVRGVGYRLI
jgi:DNA-binding response OmpR family regulator